jgi:hypothetical protein
MGMAEYSQPCVICGKTLAQHGIGAGLPVCVGIAVPTYRPTTAQAEAEALRAEVERLREALRTCRRAVAGGKAEPRQTVREIVDLAIEEHDRKTEGKTNA